ncbi:formate dehydrogenase subunit gamma [Noviherbaspirillum sp. CPCC 100848]|uniref:Formate dehydrogenase subunit gamma n=1 Tax=Noviherbaspirillum album TaxID=3080276 RepID=A0ABU6J5Z4_9BURK|nr:formate dehydrogenase subunit gamma [Noviherbaspirillum sp. CPCC 100848]MEC4718950.1 formate dehydrogenase subunit gamma [Noviherbaspirillum sp. CPCC 100848]
MKTWITGLALSLMLGGAAHAQEAKTPVAAPASAAAAPAAQAQTPLNVESIDILKQNQAERSLTQPGNNAPVWRQVKEGTNHYTSLPGPEMGVLIQPKAQFPGQDRATTAGEAWRQYRNGPLMQIGGWLLILAVLALAAVYFIKGPIRLKGARTGRLIERFTSLERITHWTVAITFLTLAISGVIMLFGKYVLLPVFGHTLFGWLAYACKNIHNFVGPLFSLSLIVMFVIFVKDNLPNRSDAVWIKRLGGAIGKEHVKSGRFNAGEKMWFWGGVTLLGLIVSASGFVLDMLVPGMLYTRGTMQVANVIHLVAAVLVFAMSLGHIYMGSIGTEGAYEAMRSGYVDDTWAREHHELWYEQVQSGEVPRVRSNPPAGGGAPVKTV